MTRLMLLLLCSLIVGGTPDAAWDSLEVGGTPDIGDAWGTPESWGALEVGDSQDDLDLSALGGSDDQLQGTFDPLDRWGALDHWGTPSVGSPSDLGSTPAPAVLGGTIARVVPGGSIARVFGNPSVGAGGDTPEAAGGDALFIESTDLPVIGDTTVIKPSFHIVSKNTTLNVTCSISNISETVDIMWSYNGLDIDYSVDDKEGSYMIDKGGYSNGTQTTTLTINGSVNLKDSKYVCRVEEGGEVVAQATVRVFLFVVTPVHAEVEANTAATLSCVFSDIIKNLTVTWELGGNDLSTVQGYTVVEGSNINFSQVSTLTVAPKYTDFSKNYTCTIYPFPSPTWSTEVRLEVSRLEVSKGNGLSPVYALIPLCFLVSWMAALLF